MTSVPFRAPRPLIVIAAPNGARLHKIHWGADTTANGREQSGSIMVNYLYDLDKIELNHEEYFDEGKISVSKSVSKLLD